ncbi:MAG: nucleoside triphosphate pyrophosphohydrolase [Candidatus Aminicenantes bacterium]|nr:nucleoside triphosphate pyrophosphohydrolase [Candidatus Aminicenantes bacterium]
MREFDLLIRLMKRLRSPVNGCPWDRSQTPGSLAKHIIEEANELAAAIQSGCVDSQIDELGDVLLQVVFLSRIHQEKGHFSIRDVIHRLRCKLIRRHPHIFGSLRAETAAEVKQLWEQVKSREKGRDSVISDYPNSMPALSVAARIGEQAAAVGFDWCGLPDSQNEPGARRHAAELALEKISEETRELKYAIKHKDSAQVAEELGDLIFSTVNVARLLGINAESALQAANFKFTRRFRSMESRLREKGGFPARLSLEEWETLWRDCKEEELKSWKVERKEIEK